MKKGLTELVFILDRSGSMHNMVEDTIGGINSIIEKQKDEDGSALVTIVQFSTQSDIVVDRRDLKNVRKLTKKDYRPSGSTALLDSMGSTIEHIEKIHRYLREEDVPEKTLFVIMTDGLENASHLYQSTQVKEMVEAKKKAGWEFMFLAANINALETAENYGIRPDNAVDFINDGAGVRNLYEDTAQAISSFRMEGRIDRKWKAGTEADFNARKNNR